MGEGAPISLSLSLLARALSRARALALALARALSLLSVTPHLSLLSSPLSLHPVLPLYRCAGTRRCQSLTKLGDACTVASPRTCGCASSVASWAVRLFLYFVFLNFVLRTCGCASCVDVFFLVLCLLYFLFYLRQRTRGCIHACTHARTNERTHAHTHARTHSCTHSRTHARARTRAHTHRRAIQESARAAALRGLGAFFCNRARNSAGLCLFPPPLRPAPFAAL